MIDFPAHLLHRLHAHGQAHVLAGWDQLSPSERSAFVEQLNRIDLDELRALAEQAPRSASSDRRHRSDTGCSG